MFPLSHYDPVPKEEVSEYGGQMETPGPYVLNPLWVVPRCHGGLVLPHPRLSIQGAQSVRSLVGPLRVIFQVQIGLERADECHFFHGYGIEEDTCVEWLNEPGVCSDGTGLEACFGQDRGGWDTGYEQRAPPVPGQAGVVPGGTQADDRWFDPPSAQRTRESGHNRRGVSFRNKSSQDVVSSEVVRGPPRLQNTLGVLYPKPVVTSCLKESSLPVAGQDFAHIALG